VAYSYRPSSVVCRSVGLSVTLVSPAKTAAPIELPFGLRTWVGPGNHVLDGDPDPHGKGQFLGENGRPIVKYRDTLRSSQFWDAICYNWLWRLMGYNFGCLKLATCSLILGVGFQGQAI